MSLLQLPEPTLLTIFRDTDALSLLNLRLTCRTFNKACNHITVKPLWERFVIKDSKKCLNELDMSLLKKLKVKFMKASNSTKNFEMLERMKAVKINITPEEKISLGGMKKLCGLFSNDVQIKFDMGTFKKGTSSSLSEKDIIQKIKSSKTIFADLILDLLSYSGARENFLIEASRQKHLGLVFILLHWGVNINRQDKKGRTALFMALACDFPDKKLVNLLDTSGADGDIKNKEGFSPNWLRTPIHYQEWKLKQIALNG